MLSHDKLKIAVNYKIQNNGLAVKVNRSR